jgi:hypothetical protein
MSIEAKSNKRKMFVKRTRIRIKKTSWECLLTDNENACFLMLKKVKGCCGKKYMFTKDWDTSMVLPNEPLLYSNNKQIKIEFDPRNESN